MVIFESVRAFFDILMSPFQSLFGFFPEVKYIIEGIVILSLGYFGWRAIK